VRRVGILAWISSEFAGIWGFLSCPFLSLLPSPFYKGVRLFLRCEKRHVTVTLDVGGLGIMASPGGGRRRKGGYFTESRHLPRGRPQSL
jgi:hypothetical protein